MAKDGLKRSRAATAKKTTGAKRPATPTKKKKNAGTTKPVLVDKYVPRSEIISQSPLSTSSTPSLSVVYWNLGGLKASLSKRAELISKAAEGDPTVICFSEHKVQAHEVGKVEPDLLKLFPKYRALWTCANDRKGYSGLVTLIHKDAVEPIGMHSVRNATVKVKSPAESPVELVSVHRGLGIPPFKGQGKEYNDEGRVITLSLSKPDMYVVFSYVPNSGDGLKRLRYRIDTWEADCRTFLTQLAEEKPVCYVGDLNVAHLDSDIWNAGAKHLEKSAGTTTEERNTFSELLGCGFVDGFRHFYPEAEGHFSYWSVRARNKPHNRGLRLDYTVASQSLVDPAAAKGSPQLADCIHLPDLCAPHGDHCAIKTIITYKSS